MTKQLVKELSTKEVNSMHRAFDAINRAQQLKQFLEGNVFMCRDKFLEVLDEELDLTKHNWDVELKKHGIELNDPAISVDWDTGKVTKEVDDASDDKSGNADDPAAPAEDLQQPQPVEPGPTGST